MKNPFFAVSDIDGSEYLTPMCSLNRAVMAKLPLYGVEDAIEGRMFKEIFSAQLVADEIRLLSRRFGLDFSDIGDHALPKLLDDALVSDDIRLRTLGEMAAKKFGNRLGLILLTLKKGERENRLARPEWSDACWDYWHELSTVILTGGLSSNMLGRRFKERIQSVFDIANVTPYHIMLFDNGAYVGVMGAAQRLMRDDTAALVLDLGHTNIKRAIVGKSGGRISEFSPMPSLESRHMERDAEGFDEQSAALELHRYIVQTIVRSMREAGDRALCDDIIISVASYTYSGVLNAERGGMAKLALLGTNYAALLSEELSSELHRAVRVRLVHDGTATALYFSDIENSVCITLGTGFGVGFPQIRL